MGAGTGSPDPPPPRLENDRAVLKITKLLSQQSVLDCLCSPPPPKAKYCKSYECIFDHLTKDSVGRGTGRPDPHPPPPLGNDKTVGGHPLKNYEAP